MTWKVRTKDKYIL